MSGRHTREAASGRTASTLGVWPTGSRSAVDDVIDDDDAMIERLDMFFLATADENGTRSARTRAASPASSASWTSTRSPSQLRRQRHVPLDGKRAAQSARRHPVHRLRAAGRMRLNGVASIDEHDPLLTDYPEAQFIVRVRATRCSRTARATSTSCSWWNGPASSQKKRVRRPCRNGSAATGRATCLPPTIRRATLRRSTDAARPQRAGDGGREARPGRGRRPRRCCRDAARRGACRPATSVTMCSAWSSRTSVSTSVERTQTSGPRWAASRGVATVAPSSSSPSISCAARPATCSSIAVHAGLLDQREPGHAPVDVRHRRRSCVEAPRVRGR